MITKHAFQLDQVSNDEGYTRAGRSRTGDRCVGSGVHKNTIQSMLSFIWHAVVGSRVGS